MFSDAPARAASCKSGISLFRLQNVFHQIGGRRILQIEKSVLIRENARQIFHRETIVSRGHRRVRRENALAADLLDVFAANRSAPGLLRFFSEQFQREQRRVALRSCDSA